MQTALALATGLVSLALTGHRSGLAIAMPYAVAVCVWLVLLVSYRIRSRQHRRADNPDRRGGDRRAALSGVLGLLVPLVASIAVTQVEFDGALFDSVAATFTAVCFCVGFVAILVSSMVDWYLILPFVDGLLGRPIWATNDEWLTAKRRRAYAKFWVAHRIACETFVYMALALVLSIVFVAVGNAVSSDNTLPVAIESLGGSGIAFALLTFLGPRIRDSVNYILGQNAGLGAWAAGVDNHGKPIEGLVIDVSIHPGVQLRTADEARRHVSLANAAELQDMDSWPADAGAAWREQMFRERGTEVADDDRPPRRTKAGGRRRA